MKPRVVIADDHVLLHGALEKLLEEECEVLGCFADGQALLDTVPRLKPEVLVVDIAMPLINGLDSAQRIKRLLPQAKLIFMTASEDPDVMDEAFRRGASGYLLKHSAASELLTAIREVRCGRRYITPLMAQHAEWDGLRQPPSPTKTERLTVRQREILQLLAEGHSMRKAAGVLGIRPRTVAYHKYRLMEKFGLKNSADVIQFAIKRHLVARFNS